LRALARALLTAFRSRRDLVFETLARPQQLGVLQRAACAIVPDEDDGLQMLLCATRSFDTALSRCAAMRMRFSGTTTVHGAVEYPNGHEIGA
jgi:hypothetical protein